MAIIDPIASAHFVASTESGGVTGWIFTVYAAPGVNPVNEYAPCWLPTWAPPLNSVTVSCSPAVPAIVPS